MGKGLKCASDFGIEASSLDGSASKVTSRHVVDQSLKGNNSGARGAVDGRGRY